MSTQSQPNKPFLSYDNQIEYLIDKNVIIDDTNFVKISLRNYSYYTLINGYKDLFPIICDIEKKIEVFKNPINFSVLHSLHVLDTNLNSILFKYIIHVERSLKTKIAYIVADKYGVYEEEYLYFRNYRNHGKIDRLNEMKLLKKQLKKEDRSASVDHYRRNHNHIPPWIAVNVFYFGSVINWYKILEPDFKKQIANEFLNYFVELTNDDILTLFPDSLTLLQKYRNNIAHGNRTFESQVNSELPKTELLKAVPEKTLSEQDFLNNIGKKDLFAVMISLVLLIEDKYMLVNFIRDLNTLFAPFIDENEIIFSEKGNVFETLDIPNNYEKRLISLWKYKYP